VSLVIADSLADALSALAGGARPIAGGSDLVVGARQGTAALPEALVAIDRLDELKGIVTDESGVRIGAGVTHAELMTDPVIVDGLTALADAAALVGSPSTRNVGTIGGNVMNASPAMDTGAPLVVLGATVELATTGGSRRVPVSELWDGPGTTTAAADELCVALHVPPSGDRSGSAYVRLEYRRAMEIAVVGAAAAVTLDDSGALATARVALTAVAPSIVEVTGLDLTGRSAEDAVASVADAARGAASPISDLRASDGYRLHTVGVMASRAVDAAIRRAGGDSIAVPVNRAEGIGASR